MCNCEIWGCFTLKTPLNGSELAITSQNKMLNNFETVRDKRNMSMNHDYETGVALSDSLNKKLCKTPPCGVITMTLYAIKPRYLGNHASQIKSYYGSLSGSHGRNFKMGYKNRLSAPWRRTDDDVISGLQLYPYTLGNHASQIKSDYGTLTRSHGRSLRIRHEKCVQRPLSEKSR